MFVELLTPIITNLEALIVAVMGIATAISGIIAKIQRDKAKEAEKEAIEQNRYANETQAFFDPENTQVMTPPEGTPERSWKMSDAVKGFLLAGETDEDKTNILKQVDAAEKAGYVDYKVTTSRGWYDISYGQISGGGKY